MHPEPEPEPEVDPKPISGFFVAVERPDVALFLHDDEPGTSKPEEFWVRRYFESLPVYSFGIYTENRTALSFTSNLQESPQLTQARWAPRPTTITVNVSGYGTLTFRRVADLEP